MATVALVCDVHFRLVVGPAAKLERARLIVEREALDQYGTRGLEHARWHVAHMAIPLDQRVHLGRRVELVRRVVQQQIRRPDAIGRDAQYGYVPVVARLPYHIIVVPALCHKATVAQTNPKHVSFECIFLPDQAIR